MAIELLQHAIERFGVVTVMDITLFDYATGRAVMELDSLKLSNITAEGQQKEIKGGRYADILVSYNYGRTLSLEFQDALLSFGSMKTLWGAEIERDATKITEHTKATGVSYVTAGITPLTGTVLDIMSENPAIEILSWKVATGKLLAYSDANETTEITTGTKVTVYYEVALTDPTIGWEPVQALIKSSSFPKTVKMVGKTIFVNEATGRTVEAEIEIPKLKLASNFTLSMEAEGDASVFDFTGMAMINPEKELLKIKTLRYLD